MTLEYIEKNKNEWVSLLTHMIIIIYISCEFFSLYIFEANRYY